MGGNSGCFEKYINYQSRHSLGNSLNDLITKLGSRLEDNLTKPIMNGTEDFEVEFDNDGMKGLLIIHLSNNSVFGYDGQTFPCYVEYMGNPKLVENIETELKKIAGIYTPKRERKES